jgi:hypothetical protein
MLQEDGSGVPKMPGLKATLFDPYVCLYEYAQASLVAAYEAFSAQSKS